MMERALMTADELKSIPKGNFVVMKTGCHPMRTRLRLFLDWGISFEEPYTVPERANRQVAYASRRELEASIYRQHGRPETASEKRSEPSKRLPARDAETQPEAKPLPVKT